jgi:hypothetical protein
MTHRAQRSISLGAILGTLICCATVLPAPTVDAFLDNGTVRIGVSRSYGGAITWLSTNGGANLINNFDRGRQIQQSYYAGASLAATKPVSGVVAVAMESNHGRRCEGNSSPVLVLTNFGDRLYMKAQPLCGTASNVLSQSFIELWIGFRPALSNVVVVDNLFTSFRDEGDAWGGPAKRHQENSRVLLRLLSQFDPELYRIRAVAERLAGHDSQCFYVDEFRPDGAVGCVCRRVGIRRRHLFA